MSIQTKPLAYFSPVINSFIKSLAKELQILQPLLLEYYKIYRIKQIVINLRYVQSLNSSVKELTKVYRILVVVV